MSYEKTMRDLISYCFALDINMNDVFCFATADSCRIPADDALDLLPYIKRYGFVAIVAYEAIDRGHDPDPECFNDPNLQTVKKLLIRRMGKDKDFLINLSFKKKKEQEQIEKYGGVLQFEFVKPSQKETDSGQTCMTCVCTCNDLEGRGTNMREAELALQKAIESTKNQDKPRLCGCGHWHKASERCGAF
jgi:hypothetical protein